MCYVYSNDHMLSVYLCKVHVGTLPKICSSATRQTLGSEDAWDSIITGGDKESRGGRGVRSEKVLLKTGMNGTRSETLLNSK